MRLRHVFNEQPSFVASMAASSLRPAESSASEWSSKAKRSSVPTPRRARASAHDQARHLRRAPRCRSPRENPWAAHPSHFTFRSEFGRVGFDRRALALAQFARQIDDRITVEQGWKITQRVQQATASLPVPAPNSISRVPLRRSAAQARGRHGEQRRLLGRHHEVTLPSSGRRPNFIAPPL